MSKTQISNSGFPLDIDVNVDIKVTNAKGQLKQHIRKHNKATSNMAEGIVRFLRGEFNETSLDIDNIGLRAHLAKRYIPTYIGFGNIGATGGKNAAYDENDQAQYTDNALRREIFPVRYSNKIRQTTKYGSLGIPAGSNSASFILPYHESVSGPIYPESFKIQLENSSIFDDGTGKVKCGTEVIGTVNYITGQVDIRIKDITIDSNAEVSYERCDQENTRVKISRSTSGNAPLSDTYQLVISGYYQFTKLFGFYDASGALITPREDLEDYDSTQASNGKSYMITELGLFSGNANDPEAKLLARLLLNDDSPLILDSTSIVVVNWTLGVYSINDRILNSDSNSGYKYKEKKTTFTGAVWQIENCDENC